MNSHGLKPQLKPLAISKEIIGAAIKVHTDLGPGLLESVYESCLMQVLVDLGLRVEAQVPMPVIYAGRKLECGYRIDLLVEGSVIVEVKSVEALAPVHHAQTLTYLKLSGKSLALLINFNTARLKDGIRRFVMGTNWR